MLDGPYALFDELAMKWEFPDYFGRNWHAVDDCLSDMSCMTANGFVTVLRNDDDLRGREPTLVADLTDTFATVGDLWSSIGSSTVLPVEKRPFTSCL